MTVIDRRYSVAEGIAIKAPCRAATTANITLAGLQTIDGIALAEHDRVLVKSQTDTTTNGIYEASSGNWQRTKDFDGAYDVVHGTRVYIPSGTQNAGREYTVTTEDPITIGTSGIVFSGSNLASSVIPRVFNTYADMLAASFAVDDYVILLGYYSVGDGGGGEFTWSSSSSATANGGTIVRPTAYAATNGRLLRIYDGVTIYPRWFGAKVDGVTDDTSAIQATFNALASYQRVVFPAGKYYTNGCITCTTDNVSVHFDDAVLMVGDTGAEGTIDDNGPSSGKIAYLFQNILGLNMTGSFRMIGEGVTIGSTSLAGMVFIQCDNALVPCTMYFEKLAGGRFIQWCDRSKFGDVLAKDMNGLQTFQSPPTDPQGSAEVVVGCKFSMFGNALGYDNQKPVRYLSPAYDADNNAIDNDLCVFGATQGESASLGPVTDTESSVLAIRSATRCSFGPVHSETMGQGVIFQQYSGDDDFSCDDNVVASVTGDYPSTGRSLDAAITQSTESARAMGKNSVLSVKVSGTGESLIFCSAGELTVRDAELSGSDHPAWGQDCILNFGRLVVSNAVRESIIIGNSCRFTADYIDIRTGHTGSASGAIRYDSTQGTGSLGLINISSIIYARNGVGTDYLFVVLDAVNGFQSWRIGHIFGTGSSGQGQFASETFSFDNGRVFGAATPSPGNGTYSVGAAIWKSTVAAGGSPGWVCTSSPSTWKAMANVAA